MIDLEARVKELETKNAELEERLSTLQNENQMLRQVHLSLPLHSCNIDIVALLFQVFLAKQHSVTKL